MRKSAKKIGRRAKKVAASESVGEARVFMTGRSQAVRLPKEYRVTGDSVFVKRLGTGILLVPKTVERWAREGRILAYHFFRASELEVWMLSCKFALPSVPLKTGEIGRNISDNGFSLVGFV